jgi:hypothetical protein
VQSRFKHWTKFVGLPDATATLHSKTGDCCTKAPAHVFRIECLDYGMHIYRFRRLKRGTVQSRVDYMRMTSSSKYLARPIGPSLIVLPLTEMLNTQILQRQCCCPWETDSSEGIIYAAESIRGYYVLEIVDTHGRDSGFCPEGISNLSRHLTRTLQP